MARVIVIDERASIARLLVERLRESPIVDFCDRAPWQEESIGEYLIGGYAELLSDQSRDTVVYYPRMRAGRLMSPDLEAAELVFQQCARIGIRKMVLLSSAMIYGASPHNEGLVPETHSLLGASSNPVAIGWRDLETLAASYLGPDSK